jgi:hypothetical protein
MRTKIRNIFGTKFSGALGKEMVASSWKGHEYIREYSVPSGEPSDRQLEQRAVFAQSAQAWQALSPKQQQFYDRIADGMTGYNVFMGRAAQAIRAGHEPETPIVLRYVTEDGQPVPGADLIVRQGSRQVWVDDLKDAKGEVALTPSDAPYVFLLRKGTQEDEVLRVKDLLETDVPAVLESESLGIRLVLDLQVPAPTPPAGGGATA